MSIRFLFALIALPCIAAHAQSPLQEVVITATKGARAIIEVPATVAIIDAAAVDRQQINNIKDLVRYEPGVSVRSAATRFGLSDFNIRGIDGNRVLLEVDNVRLPDAFSFGSFAFATRDGVDVDLLKRVEIVRGSASSLYGSNAIGGVVAFTTKDPVDVLTADRPFGGSFKLGYSGEDNGRGATGLLAGRAGAWSALLAYTRRDSGTLENQGRNPALDGTRTVPNPQHGYSDGYLGKLLWSPRETDIWRLTVERNRTDVFVDVITSRGAAPTLSTLLQLANDEQRRNRVSLDYEFRDRDWRVADGGELRLYKQDSRTRQYTTEERIVRLGPTPSARLREREFNFNQDSVGTELTLRKAFPGQRVSQLITYGAEFLTTDIDQSRDGFERNRTTGLRSNVVGADVFPVRDTPLARARQTSAYVQNEITLGTVTITPALRVDRYELDPQLDAVFAADNPGIVPVSLTDTSVSPRLGVVWRASENFAVFGSYSAGFRAPPFNDVNVGFTNPLGRYTTIPNPQLQPESSDNLEIGMRRAAGSAFWSASLYFNTHDDFIESLSFVGVQPGSGWLLFQSRNLDQVRTYGLEVQGAVPLAAALPGLRLKAALSHGVGDNTSDDQPLNTTDPAKGVFGFEYRPAASRWGAELIATVVDRKRRIDQRSSTPARGAPATGALFASPGYTSLDLLADLRLWDGATVNVGLLNLTDKKYWEWSDVRGRSANDPALDYFTRPGRSLSANLRLNW